MMGLASFEESKMNHEYVQAKRQKDIERSNNMVNDVIANRHWIMKRVNSAIEKDAVSA